MSEQTFMSIINELEVMLNKVDKSYYEFVDSIVFDCRAQGEEFTRSIVEFIESNPTADSSDVLEYELYMLGLPYCVDGVWYQKDRIITKEEAYKISEAQFHDK